jgi:hypothetical protein
MALARTLPGAEAGAIGNVQMLTGVDIQSGSEAARDAPRPCLLRVPLHPWRYAACAAILILYPFAGWRAPSVLIRDGLRASLTTAGVRAKPCWCEGWPAIQVGALRCYISPGCTWVNLWLCVSILLWRRRQRFRRNTCRVILLAVAVVVVNIGLLVGAVWLGLHDVPWFLAHNAPCVLVYALALLWAARGLEQEDVARSTAQVANGLQTVDPRGSHRQPDDGGV